jgi:hypothetical protein
MLSLCLIDRGFHRLWLLGHFHDDVSPILGQGIRVTVRVLDYSNHEALQGGHDRAEGDLAKEGSIGVRFLNASQAHMQEVKQE